MLLLYICQEGLLLPLCFLEREKVLLEISNKVRGGLMHIRKCISTFSLVDIYYTDCLNLCLLKQFNPFTVVSQLDLLFTV